MKKKEIKNEVNMKEKGMNGLQIRLVVAAFAFLCVLGLSQIEVGKNFLEIIKMKEIIMSNEDIYRVEDKIVLWYNDVINEDKDKNE